MLRGVVFFVVAFFVSRIVIGCLRQVLRILVSWLVGDLFVSFFSGWLFCWLGNDWLVSLVTWLFGVTNQLMMVGTCLWLVD